MSFPLPSAYCFLVFHNLQSSICHLEWLCCFLPSALCRLALPKSSICDLQWKGSTSETTSSISSGSTFVAIRKVNKVATSRISHALAQARYGASIFWMRPGMLIEASIEEFIAYWEVKRDGSRRGIVEVVS